ncbi:MAG: ABC transporter substrate-binding protein [Candidatus Rokubacteria bacterium]|nr:ABC transporter substrate-binding protein [Candidatus Rokubacteria bacterium]
MPVLTLVALIVTVLVLAPLAPAPEAQQLPKVKYMLSSKKGTTHYPATLAEHLGFFKEEGFDIEVLPGGGSGGMIRQVIAKQVDIGQGSPGAILMAMQAGNKFKGVYTIFYKDVFPMVTLADSKVRRVEDLKGGALGISDFAGGEVAIARGVLARAGLTVGKDVNLLPVGETPATALQSLKSGRVGAYMSGFQDIIALRYREPTLREIVIPTTSKFQSQIVVARQDVFDSQRKMVVALCRGLAKATLFAVTNPAAAQAVLTKVSPAEYVDPKYGRLFLDTVIDMTRPPADALAKAEFGRNHIEAWEAYQSFLITGQTAAQGALEKPQDLKGFLTNELVDDCNTYDKERIRRMARDWK